MEKVFVLSVLKSVTAWHSWLMCKILNFISQFEQIPETLTK